MSQKVPHRGPADLQCGEHCPPAGLDSPHLHQTPRLPRLLRQHAGPNLRPRPHQNAACLLSLYLLAARVLTARAPRQDDIFTDLLSFACPPSLKDKDIKKTFEFHKFFALSPWESCNTGVCLPHQSCLPQPTLLQVLLKTAQHTGSKGIFRNIFKST